MIPVLGVPYINRPDLLEKLIASIDEEIGQLIVIDNTFDGSAPVFPSVKNVSANRNFGVAASWNLIIKATPTAPWWLFVNSDVEFFPGDLAQIVESMQANDVSTMHGFSILGVSARAIGRVGLFDENFIPAYYEDDDWRYRCSLASIPIVDLHLSSIHVGSAAIYSDPHLMRENNRTFQQNKLYYITKWGGDKNAEQFTTPFDSGCPPSHWVFDLHRLADLTWRRD